jgi:hypothetical protein
MRSPPSGLANGRLRPEPVLEELSQRLLSLGREAGTPQAAAARDLVARYLLGLGYQVEVQRFSFSPASLRGFPVFGAGLTGLSLALLPLLHSSHAPPWSALAAWGIGLVALLLVASGIGLGWVPLGEPPREDANLIATRAGAAQTRRWIVAHLDTKAQGHSMAGRLVAVWTTILASFGLTALAAARLDGPLPIGWSIGGVMLAFLSGWLAGKGRLRGRSRGARDNGSGVVAAMAAAEASSDPGLGILITGAEEFGLVGARVFARMMPGLEGNQFLNVDTIDQEGPIYLVSHNSRGEQLARDLEPRMTRLGHPVRLRRLPLGIFVDSAPLSKAAPAVTVGRLTWKTLQRIHTAADTPDDLSLATARRIGETLVSN